MVETRHPGRLSDDLANTRTQLHRLFLLRRDSDVGRHIVRSIEGHVDLLFRSDHTVWGRIYPGLRKYLWQRLRAKPNPQSFHRTPLGPPYSHCHPKGHPRIDPGPVTGTNSLQFRNRRLATRPICGRGKESE